ncbi:MAG: arginyltransferase [Bryobacterales bacterium]|nr:arginyltransferase [Acidobacteriota bacterium]MCB9383848.1 arginyltransferase [Bryobacterales bacterium]
MREIVRLVEEPRACSYLPEQTAALEYRIVQELDADEYERLLERGYRRFGSQLFRPECPNCEQCVSIRVLVQQFELTAGFRRVLRKNKHIRVVRQRPSVTAAHLDLYHRYHRFMSEIRDWRRDRISRAEYVESFVSGGGAFAWQWLYYDGDELVGVALMDETPSAISLVYFFYDPNWRRASPGTYSFLIQLAHARRAGKVHAYPGYWIAANRSMAYKSRFQPFERLVGHPAAGAEPIWELDEPRDAVDAFAPIR